MIKIIEKYPVASLFLFVIVMLGFTIDAIPVSIMEARNFISAREMLTDNNWVLTTMNGDARYEKPPLPTWITAVFGFFFGIKSVLALRWPALLMVASIGISSYFISKKLTDNTSHSLINGFLVITSFYVIGITIEGPWDIYAHGFMLAALLQLFTLLNNESIGVKTSLLFILFLAASVLSKGPVSLYVLFLSFLIAYGLSYGYKGKKLNYLKLLVLLIFGIFIGAWWYMHVRVIDPETFTAIAERETSNWSSYNVRPFYYYWSFFVQSGLWTIPAFISLLYPYLKSRVRHKKAYKFSFYWTLIAVILLSVIPEKKSRYLMPVLIPLAINTGFYIDYIIREFKDLKSKKETYPVYFNFGLIGLLAILFPLSGILLGASLVDDVLIRFIITSLISLVIGCYIFKYLKAKQLKKVFYLAVSFMLSIGLLALPLVVTQTPENYKALSEFKTNPFPIYSLGYVAPEVIYNYGNKIPALEMEEGYFIPNTKQFYVLSEKRNMETIEPLSKIYTIEYLENFDLNTSKKDTRAYKTRLVNYLYKLSLK